MQYKTFFKSEIASAIARGEKPVAIIYEMMKKADFESDPSAKKAACFQLLCQLGNAGQLTEFGSRIILQNFSQISLSLPDVAKENMQRLSSEMAKRNGFSIKLTIHGGSVSSLIIPPAISKPAPGGDSLSGAQDMRDNLLDAVQMDTNRMIERRDLLFALHDSTSGPQNLKMGPAFIKEDANGDIKVGRQQIYPQAGSELQQNKEYLGNQAPPKNHAEISCLDSRGFSGSQSDFSHASGISPSVSENHMNAPGSGPVLETFVDPVARPDVAEECRFNDKASNTSAAMSTGKISPHRRIQEDAPIIPSKRLQAGRVIALSMPAATSCRPLGASSDKGEAIIRRLIEKMKNHGRPTGESERTKKDDQKPRREDVSADKESKKENQDDSKKEKKQGKKKPPTTKKKSAKKPTKSSKTKTSQKKSPSKKKTIQKTAKKSTGKKTAKKTAKKKTAKSPKTDSLKKSQSSKKAGKNASTAAKTEGKKAPKKKSAKKKTPTRDEIALIRGDSSKKKKKKKQ